MEAKEVRYVGKLQKGRKFFLKGVWGTNKNRGVKRMRDRLVSQSLPQTDI